MPKQSIPKGTRDFSPLEMNRRNYIFDIIKQVFTLHGFLPIETPSMENLSTLTGKYGDEGDQLIFKILNSGDFIKGTSLEKNEDHNPKKVAVEIAEKALRYDLTVPFARYVVMHQNEITFPFKRYQIQPVWRADRPQKGRYREFYQCDADIIGSNSLLNEVELIQLFESVFSKLNLPVIIKINNRKILSGIAEITGEGDKIIDITVAIDKLDKIGIENVIEELKNKNLSASAIDVIIPILEISGSNEEKLTALTSVLSESKVGMQGIEELREVFELSNLLNIKSKLELDITLARGLNYYTGAIFEVKANAGSLSSSICGGGRYDDLTGIFGLPGVSGVGISFGADRIYDVLEELKLFPADASASTKLLFVNFGKSEATYLLPLLNNVRAAGIACELYPDQAKMKKQMSYADSNRIPFVAIVGEEEMNSGLFTLKNMKTGEQEKIPVEQIVEKIKST